MRSYFKNSRDAAWFIAKESLSACFNSSLFIILLGCTFIIFEFEAAYYYQTYVGTFDLKQPLCMVFYLIYTLICFAALPFMVANLFFKDKFLGLQLPDLNFKSVLLFVAGLPACVACLIWLCHQPSFRNYYNFTHDITLLKLLIVQFTFVPAYYVAEEFFFRGFLFLPLWNRIGWHGLWITEVLFAVAHVGKPGLEILYAIPVGIVLNLLTLWSRSILPSILFHASLGIILNFIIYFNLV